MSGYDPNVVMEQLTTSDCINIVWAVLEGDDPLAYALEIVGIEQTPKVTNMTEVGVFLHSNDIDGQTVVNEDRMVDSPHEYALDWVSREGMVGSVAADATILRSPIVVAAEEVKWTYSGSWRSFDDEPYELLLVAEFTERVRS